MKSFKLQLNKRLSLNFIIVLLLSIGACGGGGGGSNNDGAATDTYILSWTAPGTNADGSTLTDLVGYKIYVGTTSGTYSNSYYVGNVTTYTVSGLSTGTEYFAVITAWDIYGNESAYSLEVSKTI